MDWGAKGSRPGPNGPDNGNSPSTSDSTRWSARVISLITSASDGSRAKPQRRALRLGQRKDDHHGGGGRGPPESRRASRGGSHVLLAMDRVCDDAASDGTARVEWVEDLAALRVEDQEVPCQLASENQVRRCALIARRRRRPRRRRWGSLLRLAALANGRVGEPERRQGRESSPVWATY
jgi:hypothetical protein